MKHSVPHDLGLEKARQAADAAINSYKQRFAEYDPKATWVSENRAEISFSVKGVSLRGALEVKPASIDMDLDVPFLLRPFKGKAQSVIESEVRAWVEKARTGAI